MKKIIRIFFIISLVCFSFFYTDKVMNLLNSKDPLMVKLNDIKKDYDKLYSKYKDKYDSYKLKSYLKGKLYQKGYTIDEINKEIDE